MNRENTVLFFKDLYKTLSAIPPKDAGILMTALFAEANGEQPVLKGSKIAEALFPMAADQMRRLEEYRSKQAAKRSKKEQSGTSTEQNRTNKEQNGSPYPYPSPSPLYIGRNQKVQKAFGFSTERTNVNYDDIVRERVRKEAEE